MQNRPSKLVAQIVSSYLEAMETNPRFADWQVKQAADAILLYADKYLKPKPSLLLSNGSIESKPMGPNNGRNSADWKEIFNKLYKCQQRMGLAMGLSLEKPGSPSFEWQGYAPSYSTQHSSKSDKKGFEKIGDFETCKLPHAPAKFCNTSSGSGI
jgi:hypothetical protein